MFNHFFKWESTKVRKILKKNSPSIQQAAKPVGATPIIVSRDGKSGNFSCGDALGFQTKLFHATGFPAPIIRENKSAFFFLGLAENGPSPSKNE
jgi:hypothetical protein